MSDETVLKTTTGRGRTDAVHAAAATMKSNHYDRNSAPQRADVQNALTLVPHIVAPIVAAKPGTTVNLCDFGSGNGDSSCQFLHAVTDELQEQSAHCRVMMYRNDLQTNDFNAVARNLTTRAASGFAEFLAPGSFYDQILPDATLHAGTCFAALHWLGRIPQCRLLRISHEAEPDCGQVYSAFAATWQNSWRAFLAARAAELVPGPGRLVVSIIGRDQHETDVHGPFQVLQDAAFSLLQDGLVGEQIYQTFFLPIHRPKLQEVLRPFARQTPYHGLSIELSTTDQPCCPFWHEFLEHGNAAAYAERYTAFIRSLSEASMRYGLLEAAPVDSRSVRSCTIPLLDTLYERVRRLNQQHPERYRLKRHRILMLLRAGA